MKEYGLTESEWKIMNLLWEKHPLEISDMVEALKEDTGWNRATVNTLLIRLMDKGCVKLDHSVRTKKYYPLLDQEEAVRREAQYSLSKVRTNRLGLLICSLADASELSENEVDELYRMLRQMREERGEKT
ncbi:MAG: BlaI/MecI/CopY family transcriptional regulator [Lachnospiraceae bacterium]|nr:BlaI/MecI/CopY family transcriptional regulator [Lachnospiraceae bacterium]